MTNSISNHVYTSAPDVFCGIDNDTKSNDIKNNLTQKSAPAINSNPGVAIPASSTKDVVQFTTQPKKKRGFVGSINNFISNCKKLGAGIAEFAKGTTRGIFQGAAIGGSIIGVGKIDQAVKNHASIVAARKDAVANGIEFTKELKTAAKTNKLAKTFPALAIVAGAVALGVNIWKAKLNYNERRSQLEHRYEEPHLNY